VRKRQPHRTKLAKAWIARIHNSPSDVQMGNGIAI